MCKFAFGHDPWITGFFSVPLVSLWPSGCWSWTSTVFPVGLGLCPLFFPVDLLEVGWVGAINCVEKGEKPKRFVCGFCRHRNISTSLLKLKIRTTKRFENVIIRMTQKDLANFRLRHGGNCLGPSSIRRGNIPDFPKGNMSLEYLFLKIFFWKTWNTFFWFLFLKLLQSKSLFYY